MMYRCVESILHDKPLCRIDSTQRACHVISNIGKPLFSISHGMCHVQNRFYMTCMPCHIEYGKFCKPPDSILHGILAMSYRIWKFQAFFRYVDSIPHSSEIMWNRNYACEIETPQIRFQLLQIHPSITLLCCLCLCIIPLYSHG